RHQTIQYSQNAYTLPLLGGFHRIGLTEAQAQREYSKIQTLTTATEYARLSESNALYCKLVLLQSGTIIGIHLLGLSHSDIPSIFEHIIQKRLTIHDLPQQAIAVPILQQLFEDSHRQWIQIEPSQNRDRLEKYFRAKRKQFS
ncbi:MAG: hypothetical protein HC810_08525, partial [Acaryochloridaceae cyanobacterium RL_2_7]|nr:hypothetical protein [Acaryochloridaceae cyanobacterium RL_2_7]